MASADQLHLSNPSQWNARLKELPARETEEGVIPAFFFAHGHPGVVFKSESTASRGLQSVGGSLHNFLKDFGPALIDKYRPKGIVVFSAHWESPSKEIKVTDYGNDQPLLYDYYGFPPEFYQARWHSNGSSELTQRVLACLKEAGMQASRTTRDEPRGRDGLVGPAPGLDHGVFIPFMLMFPEGKEGIFPIPVVQVSMDGSLDPARNIQLGQAVAALRHQGILILSGGLTIHTFEDFHEWQFDSASEAVKQFEREIVNASLEEATPERFQRMIALKKLKGFRKAHPREDHFIPIYIAAGAGSDQGSTTIISDIHGCQTIAFGVA
ncbi:hypothetical protein PTTG_05056 [Puccinia triticina 1-1 BBBD Race 1]|uniref:LigB domain-containing protein n=2 Tax=Puccinia triticina TaxID=208348 RepID=A0A180H4W0_PUCT1|nr:uncharacterized protein PtA15_2A638 [Puccinia triticina]OAV99824.1 hypothetical protein PTTG_05056 [Puccinia triticina 1-1 BBBD Race 1]WAQ82321.1 hypothetical protein PtA15_2A638 [Puccinia triticina]WAR53170.1 hypothetical protein PtB15_2B601 [Puccinia triticina]